MKHWIFSTQPASVVVVGITSFFLLCGPTESAAQEVCQAPDEPIYIHSTNQPVAATEALERSIRFQMLASEWHVQRGATSSIEQMCTRPAYLSIMAMGPDALPLIIGQLKSEGNDPDHWFVALHHISRGANPVPNEDRGNLVKMSRAWLDWAEREGYAR